MDHSTMQHGHNPSMGMEGHNHAMMIADFKRRFYAVLISTIPIVLLSTMIQKFIGVYWDFKGSKYILFALSAKHGLLIKNRTAFESARKITTIVFDKTGTLTVGKFEVSKTVSLKSELSENEIIRSASELEQKSEHPIATGIMQKGKDLSIVVPSAENFNAVTGKGVEATVEGKKILVV